MKILSNKKYEEICGAIRDYSNQISSLKEDYDDLWISYSKVFKCKDEEIAKLNDLNNHLNSAIDELKAETKTLRGAKGGYVKQINKLNKNLEETQKKLEETEKKLEESLSDKYLVKKIPMGKLPKGQVMKMKSHAKQDKIIQKIYEKMENDEI